MIPSLGGPGVSCSAMRIRRLEAGELLGEERFRTEAHVATCGRCQGVKREIARERADVAAALPFEALAAGVAERLAHPASARRSLRTVRMTGFALAAGLVFAAAIPAVLRVAEDTSQIRTKGGAELTVWVRGAADARPLAPGEPVPAGASLRIGLSTGGRSHAAVVLHDADGAAVLFAGPVEGGALPGAFEWTGSGEGALIAVLDDSPVDAAALARRVTEHGMAAASPGGRAEVVVRQLRRDAR
jgi:hypothetical protein